MLYLILVCARRAKGISEKGRSGERKKGIKKKQQEDKFNLIFRGIFSKHGSH